MKNWYVNVLRTLINEWINLKRGLIVIWYLKKRLCMWLNRRTFLQQRVITSDYLLRKLTLCLRHSEVMTRNIVMIEKLPSSINSFSSTIVFVLLNKHFKFSTILFCSTKICNQQTAPFNSNENHSFYIKKTLDQCDNP